MEWLGLLTLVVLEIVLGVDNLLFIAILVEPLPPESRTRTRLMGVGLAVLIRLALLGALGWVVRLSMPFVVLFDHELAGRDLVMIAGGGFLLYKATRELHQRIEGATAARKPVSRGGVVLQIVLVDLVFSIDSIVTALGMVEELVTMVVAVIVSAILMTAVSGPLVRFITKRPSLIVLGLGFLLMVGFSLVAEGFGWHIPKSYLYAAIGFSLFIEVLNQLRRR
jgi:predicted tellurium resistance membrane protein TerC